MGSRCRKHSWTLWEGAVEEEGGLCLSRDRLLGCWPPLLPGSRSLPTLLAKLVFIFIFCYGFYWHFLTSLLTVSNQIGTDEAWEDQLEPSHYSCPSNSRVSVSCPILSSDPSSPCFYWHVLYTLLLLCVCNSAHVLVLGVGVVTVWKA